MQPATPIKPTIAITMGDPAGVGAEVVVKALADPEIRRLGRFIIYGLDEAIEYAADLAEINPYWFRMPHEDVDEIRSGVRPAKLWCKLPKERARQSWKCHEIMILGLE